MTDDVIILEGGETSGQGQKRPLSPCRTPSGRAKRSRQMDRSPSYSTSEHSHAASDAEDANPSDAESTSSKGSFQSTKRSSWKYVTEGKWVKTQWLSARCLSDATAESDSDDKGPSKELAYGKMSSDWDRISTNRFKRKWAHAIGAPSFAAPKADDSLSSAFEHVKTKSKAQFNLLNSTMNCTGAAAHAMLSAKAYIQCFLNELPKNPPSRETWNEWRASTKEAFKTSVLSPLSDATTCLAAVSNNCVKDVRRLVIATPQAKQLKSALKDAKPSASHYFGNESEKVNSAISSAFMLKSLDDKSSTRRFLPAAKTSSYTSRQSQSRSFRGKNFKSGSATSRKHSGRGNATSRPPRGKGAGKE